MKEGILELGHEFTSRTDCRSKNQRCIEQLTNASYELMKISYMKTKLDFRHVEFEFVMNDVNQIWLLDTNGITVWDMGEAKVEKLEKLGYEFEPPCGSAFQKIIKCEGIYCNYNAAFQKSFTDDKCKVNRHADEKEELNNIYLVAADINVRYTVAFKSILIDLVERYKTYERVKKSCPKLDQKHVPYLSEGLIFKFRKFYTMADVHKFNLFRHLNIQNVYYKKKVCGFCKAMYDKIDFSRATSYNKQNMYLNNKS